MFWAAYDLALRAYQRPAAATPAAPPTKCPSCHTENDTDAKFCKGCGRKRTVRGKGAGLYRVLAAVWALAFGALALSVRLFLPLWVQKGQ